MPTARPRSSSAPARRTCWAPASTATCTSTTCCGRSGTWPAPRLPPKLPVIRGDRDKITLALHNLMGNALKYTPDGGKVTLEVEVDGKNVSISVTDTGIGISPDDAERIFERFYRAKDPRVAKITGTGLGLTLAREVVRMHGGDITVESQIDQGSTFTMPLPVKA